VTALTPLAAIERAAARIRRTATRTPLVDVSWLAGRPLWLKCENLQVGGAFKIRGAFNMIANLPDEARRRGVITYSSGNHAQAVAYAARSMGISAVVVMPTTASAIKVEGTRGFGAEVQFEGTTSVERRARAEQEASARGLTIVPPFDHPDIIAGQGTVGREVLEDAPSAAAVYVPIGGGGLIAGVAAAVKHIRPATRVVGVEPVGAAKMTVSLQAGQPVTLDTVASVADGLLPVRPGDLTFAHVQAYVDEVVTLDDTAITRAVDWLFRRAKLVVEPSGAATVAAILFGAPAGDRGPAGKGLGAAAQTTDDGDTVAVLSGGNISLDALSKLIGR
jgi:threonine dehydratase